MWLIEMRSVFSKCCSSSLLLLSDATIASVHCSIVCFFFSCLRFVFGLPMHERQEIQEVLPVQERRCVMVGGVVTSISRSAEKTHVTVAECPHYPSHAIKERPDGRPICSCPDTCSVYTDEIDQKTGKRVEVAVGDSLWWQSGRCYWTPKANRGKTCDHQHHYSCQRAGIDYDHSADKDRLQPLRVLP